MKILFVEDNAVTAAHLRQRAGVHQIHVATTSLEGAAAIMNTDYDFAVVDWFLDEKEPTGLALIQAARRVGVDKPMILVTAVDGPPFHRLVGECAKLEKVGILPKPYTIDSLIAVANRLGGETPPSP